MKKLVAKASHKQRKVYDSMITRLEGLLTISCQYIVWQDTETHTCYYDTNICVCDTCPFNTYAFLTHLKSE